MRVLFLLLFSSFVVTAQKTINFKVHIENIETVKGNLYVSVYDKSKGFLDYGAEIKTVVQKVSGKTLCFNIKLLENTDYSFAVYQDLNLDNVCNTNFIGVPTEPYGISKVDDNVLILPSFNSCKINTANDQSISIKLLY